MAQRDLRVSPWATNIMQQQIMSSCFLVRIMVIKKYEQISYIEVLGGEYSKTDDLVKELRRKAKSVGADAVIDIRKGRRVRKETDGVLLLLNIAAGEDSSHTSREYRSDNLQGLAIKYLD